MWPVALRRRNTRRSHVGRARTRPAACCTPAPHRAATWSPAQLPSRPAPAALRRPPNSEPQAGPAPRKRRRAPHASPAASRASQTAFDSTSPDGFTVVFCMLSRRRQLDKHRAQRRKRAAQISHHQCRVVRVARRLELPGPLHRGLHCCRSRDQLTQPADPDSRSGPKASWHDNRTTAPFRAPIATGQAIARHLPPMIKYTPPG